jgi:NAD(P)-dependent dehydrogenase (short-subunit alcohol dehydrogenase family)
MTGRVVAVFGSGPGIGRGSAEILMAAGATIAFVDIDQAVAEESASMLSTLGRSTSSHAANVLDRSQVQRCLQYIVGAHGGLDGVVNVVGRSLGGKAVTFGDDDWEAQMAINLRHHLIVAQEATPHLEVRQGAYVAISSQNGLRSAPGQVAYGVAKAGLNSLMRTLALELAPRGVRFNAVAPGLVHTPYAESRGLTSGDLYRKFLELIPLGRLAQPSDVGNAVLFLLSSMGRHVTGQVISVDGGSTLHPGVPIVEPRGDGA